MGFKRRFVIGTFLALTLSLSTIAVAAGELRNSDAFYSGGGYKVLSVTENLKYYVTPDVWNEFGDYIEDAFSDYSSIPGVDFDFQEVDWADEAELIILNTQDDGTYDGLPGIMIPCDWSRTPTCEKTRYQSRWDTAAVFLFPDNMDLKGYNQTNRHKTIVHEIGHAYALVHQPVGVDSVMVGGKSTITSPTSLDISNLQFKY
jgi:hypothetical protein